MKRRYSRSELDLLLEEVEPRTGWDFSRMRTTRAPVPWSYEEVVRAHLLPEHSVLDIGTGGGERFLSFAPSFGSGVGIDVDPAMIERAAWNGRDVDGVRFRTVSSTWPEVPEVFDVVLDRHAPFDPHLVASHLVDGGVLITQQVGERNMAVVKEVLGQETSIPPMTPDQFGDAGLDLLEFREYDVRSTVDDVESLVFWLRALDALHADVDGAAALADVSVFNAILARGFEAGAFVTNEHRSLAVARKRAGASPSIAATARARIDG